MSARTALEDRHEHGTRDEGPHGQQGWHSWGSPIGLGVGLLCVGGFFVQIALGLCILNSIG